MLDVLTLGTKLTEKGDQTTVCEARIDGLFGRAAPIRYDESDIQSGVLEVTSKPLGQVLCCQCCRRALAKGVEVRAGGRCALHSCSAAGSQVHLPLGTVPLHPVTCCGLNVCC